MLSFYSLIFYKKNVYKKNVYIVYFNKIRSIYEINFKIT